MRTAVVCLMVMGAACGGGNGTADAPRGADSATVDARAVDATPDAAAACDVGCGATELCDSIHAGLDDDCNGTVDEGCACQPGTASRCFAGDPTIRGTAGCFDGVMRCEASSTWGPCEGGQHASDAPACFETTPGCHAITALPFASTALATGLGNFGADALTESYSVTCPPGAAPCPGLTGADAFVGVQSGEYTVHYLKTIAGGGSATCDFPLFVSAAGLRVELQWEHDLGGSGVDLDLHVHEPGTTTPHSFDQPRRQDCAWDNCTIAQLQTPSAVEPNWFSAAVSWYLDPTFANNTCYFAPRGAGAAWQAVGLGCHNPRLDQDNITCDAASIDPADPSFCVPENTNIDFMPADSWTRISVAYYANHALTYDVHPRVLVYFDGTLAADLGTRGYHSPETPVTFTASQGGAGNGNVWWMAADVKVADDGCGPRLLVHPIYADDSLRTPLLVPAASAQTSFGPAYPP